MAEPYKPGGFFITCCFFIAILWVLALLWAKGTCLPEPLFSCIRLEFYAGSVIFFVLGFLHFWLARNKGLRGFRLYAIGNWIVAVVLLDVSLSPGMVRLRDIILLLIALPIVLSSIVVQWKSMEQVSKELN